MTNPANFTIYAIQHSHTDIGYTERQEKICQYHVDFIRQALGIIREVRAGSRPEWQGYKWVCETFWPVETFLARATEEEREELADAFRNGDFGLSGTYLNMSELVGKELLDSMLGRIRDYAKSIDVKLESAMTADITGFSWGYGQSLHEMGIRNMITCIHTHHSMFPLRKKQTPFWWETQKGDRILIWNGEHYVFGNDLGIQPGLGGNYTIRDGMDTSKGVTFEMAEIRINRYIDRLKADGFKFPFFPAMLSGLPTDNSSPNPEMMDFVNKWNEKHGDNIRIQPATLDDFFAEVRKYADDIPVHRGDWPDWWTDGTGSTPMHVQVFREAQRVYEKVRRLDPAFEIVPQERIKQMENELMLFAEHTWGYHSSVSEPWNPFVQELGVRKDAFAANASTLAHSALYDILEAKGDALLAPNRPMRFQIRNPYSFVQEDYAHFIMEFWHLEEIKNGFEVYDEASGEVYPAQLRVAHRGAIVTVPVTLQPGEERMMRIRPVEKPNTRTAHSTDLLGADGIVDIADPQDTSAIKVTYTTLETPFVRLEWNLGDGIVSWKDKKTGEELLRADRNHNAFTPVYDVTKSAKVEEMTNNRRKMGRNRKGPHALISVGKLTQVEVADKGDLYASVRFTYEVDGCQHYSLLVTAYADKPRLDVAVRMHKNSVWDPENIYVSIPFGGSIEAGKRELWVDKLQAPTRLRIDQLPGSLIDYYCLGEGAVYTEGGSGVAIAMPDTPLIQLGSLKHEFRMLQDDEGMKDDPAHLYSWPMNNYWETNFRATLGGFYEFRYLVSWGEAFGQPDAALEACRSMNAGVLAWRVKE
ncbi:glycoside hydrolase family 38 N-terminal domain-containing protein [Paenibacillus spongiae]|uniref:Glycoside hydrolase n=1 Tax=Paenibacillus spongiae TaxID=2909671 RepID=A0ABY5SAK0_9BACL|nr:glycoside hydrolase [Paenibacillus spongiae]UVI30947.1 glycoside hydrolase [Paenibacillus spongiae]